MLGSLPAELAVAILIEAAERFIVADRATTVSLALTGRYVYNIVRPILLRVCIIDSNYYLIDDTLTNGGAGALVKDINVLTGNWVPTQEAVSCLSNLQCLRGTSHIVEAIIEMLPQSARKSLWSLELWSKQTIRRIPAGITHLCLYGYVLQTSSLDALVVWLCRAPSITHIGIDVIIEEDTTFDALQENLPLGFQRVLEVGGSRLQTIAARIQGGSVSNGDWERLLETMLSWSRNNEMAAMQADRRVALWREGRIFDDWRDETRAALDDCLAGIDLWTEACSLAEWTETVRVL